MAARHIDVLLTDVQGTLVGNPDCSESDARAIVEALAESGVQVYPVSAGSRIPGWLAAVSATQRGYVDKMEAEELSALLSLFARREWRVVAIDDEEHWQTLWRRLGRDHSVRIEVVPARQLLGWWEAYCEGREGGAPR